MNQEIRNQFKEEQTKVWHGNARMIDFCMSHTQIVVKTENGYFIAIDKPSIKKHFCFGESGYDMDDALNSAHVARTSTDYFMEENLEEINAQIADLKNLDKKCYATRSYEDSKIKHLLVIEPWKLEYGFYSYEYKMGYVEELTDKDRETLLEAYMKVREAFSKRLATYLKKYGLSKVHAWTYWRDA